MNAKFWLGKRVLVTGHTGFKGSWLSFWLNEMGAEVHGIALPPETTENAFAALDVKSCCEGHHVLDIRFGAPLRQVILDIDPEVIIHMAAQPLVRRSYADPMETYEINVIGTGNVLLAARDCAALRSLVVVTTDKCYENREWHWGYRETDTLGGHDPYSSSKACAEILTSSFRRSYFSNAGRHSVGIATVRAGNVIGGGDWSKDRLIPDLVRGIRMGNRLEIRSPMAIRPWQHVLSPLSGYLELAEKLYADPRAWSEAFNFAPADECCVPVCKLLEMFEGAWGEPMPWFVSEDQHPHEAHFLRLDVSKSRLLLNWHPRWNLRQALHATAEWYRVYYQSPQKIATLTRHQIESFLNA